MRPLGGMSSSPPRGRGGSRGGRGRGRGRWKTPSELVAEIDFESGTFETALVDSVNVAADRDSEELVRRAEAKANSLRDRGTGPGPPKTVRFQRPE